VWPPSGAGAREGVVAVGGFCLVDVNLSPTPVNPEHARLDRERTDRQRRLPGFDQDAVAAARALVIGAGGLGCPVVQALAAAGVGYLHIVDSDSVELSNIQRQPLFGVPDVGEPKAEVAARRALELCPSLTVETTIRHVDASWILDLFAASAPDCVVDCTDTFASKYLIADAAQVAGLPLVWGTVLRFGGSVSLFEPDGAHLRDIFPTIPQTVESCALAGVLGATTAVVGSLMATEVLKFVSGLPTAAGTLLTYDALSGTCTSFGAVPDPARVVPVDLSAHEVPQVLLDVREVPEREESVKHEGSMHMPLSQLSDAEGSLLPATDVPAELLSLFESVRDQHVGVFCASGARAQRFVQAYAELAGEYGVRLTAI